MSAVNPEVVFPDTRDSLPTIETELSIVIPLFNEAEAIPLLFARLENVMPGIRRCTEVILVDDGSTDSTWADITHYKPEKFSVNCIALSRNFGKEYALTAGLHAAAGKLVILLDADCQDPPELIPEMLQANARGFDVVNMKRRSRSGEGWFKLKTAAFFYRVFEVLADISIPENVGDFRLMSRRVVDEINQLNERNRYMKGILSFPGFTQVTLEYDREERSAGSTKWNYWQLLNLAISGITAFSNKPLRLSFGLGVITAGFAFIYGVWVLLRALLYSDPVAGYPSLMLAILFFSGVQLMLVGVLGEYVGRVFTEVKARPNYIVRENKVSVGASENHYLRNLRL